MKFESSQRSQIRKARLGFLKRAFCCLQRKFAMRAGGQFNVHTQLAERFFQGTYRLSSVPRACGK